MAGYVAIVVEDVLARRITEPFAAAPPNMTAVRLVSALGTRFKVALITSINRTQVEYWLTAQRVKGFELLLSDGPEKAITHLRRTGDLDLAIVGNTDSGLVFLRSGVPCLLHAQPEFDRSEFLPDHDSSLRPWGAIEDELTRQAELAENDPRMDRVTADVARWEQDDDE